MNEGVRPGPGVPPGPPPRSGRPPGEARSAAAPQAASGASDDARLGASRPGVSSVGATRLDLPSELNATIVFVRHGESVLITEGRFQGQMDSPLSPLGERQADAIARRLATPGVHPVLPLPTNAPIEIVHSPLTRTRQTAERIAAALAVTHGDPPDQGTGGRTPLRSEPGLLEIAQGEWEGLHRTEIEQRYGELLAAWRRSPTTDQAPGGETLGEVRARVRPVLERALARLAVATPPAERGHKGASGFPGVAEPDTPWSVLVGHDGVFKVALLTLFDLPLERFWSVPFAMCGLTIIEIRDGRPVLRAHNLTEHLAPLLEERAEAESEERQRSGAL